MSVPAVWWKAILLSSLEGRLQGRDLCVGAWVSQRPPAWLVQLRLALEQVGLLEL